MIICFNCNNDDSKIKQWLPVTVFMNNKMGNVLTICKDQDNVWSSTKKKKNCISCSNVFDFF